MTREEVIQLLQSGVEGIREWNRRRVAPEPVPDLTGANLAGANLAGANLARANLDRVNLEGGVRVQAKLERDHRPQLRDCL